MVLVAKEQNARDVAVADGVFVIRVVVIMSAENVTESDRFLEKISVWAVGVVVQLCG